MTFTLITILGCRERNMSIFFCVQKLKHCHKHIHLSCWDGLRAARTGELKNPETNIIRSRFQRKSGSYWTTYEPNQWTNANTETIIVGWFGSIVLSLWTCLKWLTETLKKRYFFIRDSLQMRIKGKVNEWKIQLQIINWRIGSKRTEQRKSSQYKESNWNHFIQMTQITCTSGTNRIMVIDFIWVDNSFVIFDQELCKMFL